MDNSEKQEVNISWDETTEEQFKKLIGKIPVFLRSTAEKKVSQKAECIVSEDHRTVIGEKDLVDAFFAETPFGFHGPLKCDMEEFQIDYTKYGYPK